MLSKIDFNLLFKVKNKTGKQKPHHTTAWLSSDNYIGKMSEISALATDSRISYRLFWFWSLDCVSGK